MNSLKWIITWISFALLRKSLHYRLAGAGASWLQPLNGKAPTMVNRVDYILQYCQNKRVLHIGFTDHPFTSERLASGDLLHQRLKGVTSGLAGVDLGQDGLDIYKNATNDINAWQADIVHAYPQQAISFKPSLILLTEVLEHLTDPYGAIRVLHASFEAGTMVLVTVPNYTALDSIAASLHQTESIHPDHHWYFSPYTLGKLFNEKMFRREDLKFGMYYQPGSRVNSFLKNYPFNGDCMIAVYTII